MSQTIHMVTVSLQYWDKELTTHYGFSLVDGSYLWATEPENYLDLYGSGNW